MGINFTEKSIVVGCNYHTTWQQYPGMRFVLLDFKDNQALLYTRTTKKKFWTKLDNLKFIMSDHNINKAKRIIKQL